MSHENQPQCPVKYMGNECQLDKGHVSNIHVGEVLTMAEGRR